MTRLVVLIALTSGVMSACSGCAIFVDQANRRTLNLLDEKVRFESTTAKVAAAPVFIAVGLAAGLTDAVIVHPLVSIRPAYDDTSETVWENPQGSEFRQAMIFLPKVAATPLVFVGDWALRVLFGAEF